MPLRVRQAVAEMHDSMWGAPQFTTQLCLPKRNTQLPKEFTLLGKPRCTDAFSTEEHNTSAPESASKATLFSRWFVRPYRVASSAMALMRWASPSPRASLSKMNRFGAIDSMASG